MSLLDTLTPHCVDDAGCLVWKRSCCNGHPAMRRDGKTMLVRRVLWEQLKGPIPAGHIVRMTCGSSKCICPEHMECTTYQRVAKQLGALGIMSGTKRSAAIARAKRKGHQAKLTAEAVQAIRTSDEPGTVLAARYGIAQATVSKVRLGKVWRDFASPWRGLGTMSAI